MFHILGLIFLFILAILFIGLIVLSRIIGMVFGFKNRMQRNGSTQKTDSSFHSGNEQTTRSESYSTRQDSSVQRRKKIFDKEEGEYIEFEEIE